MHLYTCYRAAYVTHSMPCMRISAEVVAPAKCIPLLLELKAP